MQRVRAKKKRAQQRLRAREGKHTWSLVARINDSGGGLPCGIRARPRLAKRIVIGDPTWCPLHRRIRRPWRRRIGVYTRRRGDSAVCVLYVLYINNAQEASDTVQRTPIIGPSQIEIYRVMNMVMMRKTIVKKKTRETHRSSVR